MATITNYATLVQSILDFSHRGDLSTFVDYFIQGAQELINNDIFQKNQGNGIRPMESTFTGTITSGTVGVPADWLAPKDLQASDGNSGIFTLAFKDAQWIYDNYPIRSPSGFPAFMARDGANFIFGPYPDASYNITGTYYAQAALLSSGATTNWMVTNCPHALLAACMKKAGPFLKDTEALAMWQGIYDDELQKLVDRDKGERWASATMQMNVG